MVTDGRSLPPFLSAAKKSKHTVVEIEPRSHYQDIIAVALIALRSLFVSFDGVGK